VFFVLGGILVGILVAAAAFLVFYYIAPRTDDYIYNDLRDAVTAAGVITVGAGVAVALRRQRTVEQNTHVALRQQQVAEDKQRITEDENRTDRYTTAVEQLANESIYIRLGGIYALGRLAEDSERDRTAIIDLLAAFVRDKASVPRQDPDHDRPKDGRIKLVQVPTDVRSALTVLGAIKGKDSTHTIDLAYIEVPDADLAQASLSGVCLTGASLFRADLRGACLVDAQLDGAVLIGAQLDDANAHNAQMKGADLRLATITDADLTSADLRNANMKQVRANGANMRGISLDGADLTQAILAPSQHLDETRLERDRLTFVPHPTDLMLACMKGAILEEANLKEANLACADLTDCDLQNADSSRVYFGVFGPPTEDPKDRSSFGANLTRTILSGVDLTNAVNLGAATLSEAAWLLDSEPKWPDGFVVPDVRQESRDGMSWIIIQSTPMVQAAESVDSSSESSESGHHIPTQSGQ